ncbi:MAG TPA: SRPBCC family protein [Noviherbaspirillum sp.]|nr:SRPBCC family protein [Noviherbaspirillum sp.]
MARIQQSIDVGVPVHVVYNQLTQFEDYPRFMQDVETVQQLDDTHLHWSAKMSYQPLEWDSEIVEQIPDRCIAWRNDGGPMQAGKVELQPVGDDMVRITMTVECDPAQVPAERSGNPEEMVALRIEDDLARLKQFIEERGSETGEWRGEVHDGQVTQEGAQATPLQAAGESIGKTVGRTAAEQQDSAQAGETTQSAASLSPSMDEDAEDGRYSIAEEQNFDQQSNQARRVGQMPLDFSAPVSGETGPAEAMAKAAKPDDKQKLQQSIERSVPPSE